MVDIIQPDHVAKSVSQVRSALPQFVIEDHPKFVEFLKAYYRWSSKEGPAAALNYMKLNNDVDFVMDSMLDSYSNLFAFNIPKEMKGDYRFFLKFLKSFYEIKGTEESYKILYRALFNEDAMVYFPRRSVFMTSSAEWSKDRSFRIRYVGNGFDLRGRTLIGENRGYQCMVSDAIRQDDQWMIFFQGATGDFIPNERLAIEGTDEYCTVVPVYAVKTVVSGQNWYDNDVIHLDDNLMVKVDKINYGSITGVTIVDGGTGYKSGDVIRTVSEYSGTGFRATVGSVDVDGAILSLIIERTGFGYVRDSVQFVGGSGNGANLKPVWDANFRTIKSASIILNKEKTVSGDITIPIGQNESITFTDGVYTVPRYWKVVRGATSTETARLHDSYFYQEFSYVISSNANAKENEEALKKVLQIAGLKLFIEQTISLSVENPQQNSLLIE